MRRDSSRRALASAALLLAGASLSRGFDTRAARRRPPSLPQLAASSRASTESLLGSIAADENGGAYRFFDDREDTGVFGPGPGRRADFDDEWTDSSAPYRFEPYELSAHELNEMFVPDSLDRHKFTVSPDAAFGAIFKWSMLVDWDGYVQLATETWEEVVGTDPDRLVSSLDRMPLCLALPHTVRRVTHADAPPAEQFKLAANYFESYEQRFAKFPHELAPGALAVLETLSLYSVSLGVCCDVNADVARAVLDSLGIGGQLQTVVAGAEHSSTGQMYLQAALSLERPPSRCVVFDDTLQGVLEAHDVLMKAVVCASRQPAYQLKPADLIVSQLDDVSMVALRALFMSGDGIGDDPDRGLIKESAAQPTRDYWGNERGATRRMVMEPEVGEGGASGGAGDSPWLYGGGGAAGGSG